MKKFLIAIASVAFGFELGWRVMGITDHLTNGWRIEVEQRMAGHLNAKPRAFMTGATMKSGSVKLRGRGF
jgi:hypothetical protein